MRKFLIYLIILLFVLSSCSNNTDTSDQDRQKNTHDEKSEKKNSKGKNEDESKLSKIKDVNLEATKDALKKQSPGILAKDVTYKKETKKVTWALSDMEKDKQQSLKKQLKLIASKTQDPKVLQKSLVYLLGSPHYKKAINKAEDFEADFDEPYLPDPEENEKKNEKGDNQQPEKAIILLDASSSMLLNVDGQQKIKVAKSAVKRFANTIGKDDDSEVSLVVYGHKGSESEADKKVSCEGIEEIYPMGGYDKKKFNKSLTKFESKGWTPLAGALKKADDMSESYDGKVTAYIVSDGKETCGGKPVKAARKFTGISHRFSSFISNDWLYDGLDKKSFVSSGFVNRCQSSESMNA